MSDYSTVVVVPSADEAFEKKLASADHPAQASPVAKNTRHCVVCEYTSVVVYMVDEGANVGKRNVPADCLLYAHNSREKYALPEFVPRGDVLLYAIDSRTSAVIDYDLDDYRQMRFGREPIYELSKQLFSLERREEELRDTIRKVTSRKRRKLTEYKD